MVLKRIVSFSCNIVLITIRYWISHILSCLFINFQKTRMSCFYFVGYTSPTVLILHYFTWYIGSNWCFQLLTRVLDGLIEFRILWVDEIDPSQFSSVFKMELFIRPLLLLLQLDVLSHCFPEYWPYILFSGEPPLGLFFIRLKPLMSFACVSKKELWNFRNSSIHLSKNLLMNFTKINPFRWRHNSSC